MLPSAQPAGLLLSQAPLFISPSVIELFRLPSLWASGPQRGLRADITVPLYNKEAKAQRSCVTGLKSRTIETERGLKPRL